MSLKSHSANSARRGEIRAKRATKQPMAPRYRLASRNGKIRALRSVASEKETR